MPTYKHMLPDETAVWERWLALANLPDDVDITYDVTVGQGITLAEDFPDPYKGNAEFLSKKRIDAVVTFSDYILIVEVKKVCSWGAIGQLIGYPILFATEYNPAIPIYSLLVLESFPLDLRDIFDVTGLSYDLVPPGATSIESHPTTPTETPPPT